MNIDQRHHDHQPVSVTELLTLLFFVLAFLGLMTLEVLSNYEPRKLAFIFFLLWWMPLVFLHEFGHAVVAKLLGWRVSRTVIGFGRVIFQGRLFQAPLELRLVPLEGFVQIQPLSVTGARFKHALIYFAGPGIELLLFFMLMLFLGGWDELLVITDAYDRLALQALAFAALVGAVINLIPMGIVTREGEAPNDGLGIIQSLMSKESDYQQWVEQVKQERQNEREI